MELFWKDKIRRMICRHICGYAKAFFNFVFAFRWKRFYAFERTSLGNGRNMEKLGGKICRA